jgi:ribosomal protein S18 acetylase RimI-like enzyme
VDIQPATSVSPELVEAFARLIPQLSSSSPPPGEAELRHLLAQPGTTVFIARADGAIVGTLTLVLFRIPTGLRAWIEDVVVDKAAEGKGIGKALTRAAIDHATAAGVRQVELTSRPSREAANHMYQGLGFAKRETNVYRYTK